MKNDQTIDAKPPMKRGKLLGIALALVVAGAVLGAGALRVSAQIQPNSDCLAAKTWHLQQAMKSTLANEQEYHLEAADAANQLSTVSGTPCAGWKDWAMARAGATEP